MHVASKLLFLAGKPSTLLVLAFAAGLIMLWHPRWLKTGRRVTTAAFAALLLAGYSPLANVLILPLEERFPRPPAPPGEVAGILLLGGFEHGGVGIARGGLALTEAAERLTESLLLARRLPSAKVVFTGGVSDILFKGTEAGPAVQHFLIEAGIDPRRIVIEGRARNTYENAVFTRELLRPKPDERWLLVTSAAHMPRAMATFRHAGFDVTAWPVDYRTTGSGDIYAPFESLIQGVERCEIALKEWAGLFVYRLLGRTDALWPAP
jgi:uncharacterized SAM-binding protein YcdF (DUF218 family)